MPKAKAKDMRPVPITWAERHKAQALLLPIINDALGVEFNGEVMSPAVGGVKLSIDLKYKEFRFGRCQENHWKGTEIQLYFKDASYTKVRRSLLIAPGADLDADKLRAKWAEILALKAEDDQLRAAKKAALENSDAAKAALMAEVGDLGEKDAWDARSGDQWHARATSSGFSVTLEHVTPAQLRAIVAIVEGAAQGASEVSRDAVQ